MWLCRAYGPTTIRRAYAGWTNPRFGRYQHALERNGVDLVQLGHGPSRKNGADIRMTVGAETSASARLVSVCSEYKLWGSIVASTDARPNSSIPTGQPGYRLADAEELLVTAMGQTASTVLTASAVKSKMVTLDPAFDEANYGCASFREFLARLGHRVHVVDRSGGDITPALISPAAEPLESSATG
ncbi:OST-HTH/LOTUS domain-containing protein [Amycolatopsis sp. DG1A-15b]|uniref:NYN domain-containing protein n=1 Tax=Amycolatopsis sp. DG1A-15b TaxID=3052846 RepID=UPI00255BFB65|nr:OST-HTH/LOTUS domain-containing protein [Amycolatopsis sp. DG1A-15b]WIX85679.1 OST-HTH/LOTUS domain-containing protein [Amycolatopsis sp. DG1A-15b]